MLILAGVTIATLTGDNGLLQKGQDANIKSTDGEIEEEIRLAWNKVYADAYINNLIVGNSVTTIGSEAFAVNSYNYTNISLPSTITSMASDAFGSGNYYNITFSKPCTDIKSMSGYPFGADSTSFHGTNDEQCETSAEEESGD